MIQGLGVSKGVYVGRVRWLNSPEELYLLQPGEILFCETTDPEWGEAFDLVGAVITRVGSILCHAAIIAREYRLPCVVNVEFASETSLDGATIRVDGAAGTIEVLE